MTRSGDPEAMIQEREDSVCQGRKGFEWLIGAGPPRIMKAGVDVKCMECVVPLTVELVILGRLQHDSSSSLPRFCGEIPKAQRTFVSRHNVR